MNPKNQALDTENASRYARFDSAASRGVSNQMLPSLARKRKFPFVSLAPFSNEKMTPPSILPYRPDLKKKARENRNNPAEPESKVWYKILQNRQLKGYKFLRQKPIENFIVDFYCFALRLVVEIDGDSHAEQEKYDIKRTDTLNQLGIKVVRYTNTDVMGSLDGIFEDLEEQVTMREKELGIQNPSVALLQRTTSPLIKGSYKPPLIPLTKGDEIQKPLRCPARGETTAPLTKGSYKPPLIPLTKGNNVLSPLS